HQLEATCLAVSFPSYDFLTELKFLFQTNPLYHTMWQDCIDGKVLQWPLKGSEGLLFLGSHIFVPKDCSIIPSLISHFHSSPIGGHAGILKTFKRLSTSFF